MMRFIIQAIAAALGFWLASRIVPGVHAGSVASLLAAGVILGVINALVRPILIFLTFPLTLLTLGLFLFVVNGITVWLTAALLHGVRVDGLWPAILASLVITVISWLARALTAGAR
jgi:putative membrane protein